MRTTLFVSTLATAGAASFAAHAQTYTIDKVIITGSKTVPTSTLYGAIKEHPGMKASRDDIIGDQDAITGVLGKANVVGGIKTQLRGPLKDGGYEVTFIVNDQGAQAPTVTHVAPKLDAQIIDGNTSIPTDKLLAATGLQPGEDMTNEKVLAAETAIQNVYKQAKLPISMSISGSTKMLDGGKVDVLWHIVETKAKKKKRNTEDEGGQQMEQ
jgi:outer membrane protein assembly factor BamA